MMRISIFIFALLISFKTTGFSQDTTSSAPKDWKWGFVGSVNGTQAAYSNWAPGGVNTVSGAASAVLNGEYNKDHNHFSTMLNLKYGGARIEGQGFQKSDDVIQWKNLYKRDIKESPWNAYASFEFRTQFYEGVDDDGFLISDFFIPAYFYENAGLGYKPNDFFSAQLGLTSKQTYVRDTTFAQGFGVSAGENLRNELGFSTEFNFSKEIVKNVKLTSSLQTFSNFMIALSSTDVIFTNELVGSINKHLSTNFQVAFVYDDDIIDEWQVKQVLSVGITYQFF